MPFAPTIDFQISSKNLPIRLIRSFLMRNLRQKR